MKKQLIKFWLDFLNDFLTVENYSEYNNLTFEETEDLLIMGKKYHDENNMF